MLHIKYFKGNNQNKTEKIQRIAKLLQFPTTANLPHDKRRDSLLQGSKEGTMSGLKNKYEQIIRMSTIWQDLLHICV